MFIPPKRQSNGTWHRKTFGYGIYCPLKDINISKRLPSLANIHRAELTAFHHVLKIIIEQYQHEPTHIFTDSLNSLYLLKIQIIHPTAHNNPSNKVILQSMINLLQSRTLPLTMYIVCAHVQINDNEHSDALAYASNIKDHRLPQEPYEHAHSTPYWLNKDEWFSME